jgi:hypothetical protein
MNKARNEKFHSFMQATRIAYTADSLFEIPDGFPITLALALALG